MRVRYSPESNVRWGLSADSGVMTSERNTLVLSGVELVVDEEGDPLTFIAGDLNLDLRQEVASTSQPVTLRRGSAETSATSLAVDLENNRYELSDAKTRFTR